MAKDLKSETKKYFIITLEGNLKKKKKWFSNWSMVYTYRNTNSNSTSYFPFLHQKGGLPLEERLTLWISLGFRTTRILRKSLRLSDELPNTSKEDKNALQANLHFTALWVKPGWTVDIGEFTKIFPSGPIFMNLSEGQLASPKWMFLEKNKSEPENFIANLCKLNIFTKNLQQQNQNKGMWFELFQKRHPFWGWQSSLILDEKFGWACLVKFTFNIYYGTSWAQPNASKVTKEL